MTSTPSSTRASTRPRTRASRVGPPDGTTLADWLRERGIEQVDVCGIATDYCVDATALDAVREGFRTTVLVELTAAVAPNSLPRLRETWRAAGIGAS